MRTYKRLWVKKYVPVLTIVLLVLTTILYGMRGGKGNGKGDNVLAGVSPDTSAFQMYYFDGETVAVRMLYNRGREKKLIRKINVIPLLEAEESALFQMDIPFYGFWSSNKDGHNISVAASGGVWPENDETVYDGNAGLSLLWEQMEGNDEDDTPNVLDFPNTGHLSAYHSISLLKVDEQTEEGPEGLTMTIEDIGTSEITVRITDKSGEDFSYGEYSSLQKQIDGQWYMMPVKANNVGFQDITNILPDGESASETYNLDMYGTLELGTYRLVMEILGAGFLMGHERMTGIKGKLAIEPRKAPFI